jgi:hypothetical protein
MCQNLIPLIPRQKRNNSKGEVLFVDGYPIDFSMNSPVGPGWAGFGKRILKKWALGGFQ